jgi:hypothetical protein
MGFTMQIRYRQSEWAARSVRSPLERRTSLLRLRSQFPASGSFVLQLQTHKKCRCMVMAVTVGSGSKLPMLAGALRDRSVVLAPLPPFAYAQEPNCAAKCQQ